MFGRVGGDRLQQGDESQGEEATNVYGAHGRTWDVVFGSIIAGGERLGGVRVAIRVSGPKADEKHRNHFAPNANDRPWLDEGAEVSFGTTGPAFL